jgi:hypothetical protein
MSLERLRDLNPEIPLSSDEVFEALAEAGAMLADPGGRENPTVLETAIRLLEARRLELLPIGSEDAVEFFVEECGLFPYVSMERFSHLSQTVIEAHSIDLKKKLYLHTKQMQALLWLLNGDNVVLSAPTSFGKSLLVDCLIKLKRPHTVVLIMPTIALIDETRSRLRQTFGETYDVISQTSASYVPERPTIFVFTQERFLEKHEIKTIDLFFVDEFYKLDPKRHDDRYDSLNIALYRALPRSKQIFMAGPHISSIHLGEKWRGNFRFEQTDYRTVTVNVIDKSANEDKLASFLEDLRSVGDDSSLVFARHPGSAVDLSKAIIGAGIDKATAASQNLADWVGANYHREWYLVESLNHGIGLHHGRVPRSLGQLFVRMFDQHELRTLICTSSLIEGVNTAASNVFVYDKKINRSDFDFFSFANIQGRVGRFMRHFVGNSFLYHEPPEVIDTDVTVPVLEDPSSASDYILINVDREQLAPAGQRRWDDLVSIRGLPQHILQDHGSYGVELLRETLDRISAMMDENPELLSWRQVPSKAQRIAVAELSLKLLFSKVARIGLGTPKQVSWGWERLQAIKSLPKFLRWFAGQFEPENPDAGLERAGQFLQACEFGFPRALGAVQALVQHNFPDAKADYSFYIGSLESWFRPRWMKQLDEIGLPLPLAERLRGHVHQASSAERALEQLCHSRDRGFLRDLTDMDVEILNFALSR